MITVIKIPNGYKELDFKLDMTIGDILKESGLMVENKEEVRVNGEIISKDFMNKVHDKDSVTILQLIKGSPGRGYLCTCDDCLKEWPIDKYPRL